MGARFALAGQQGVTEDLIADIPHYRESKLLTDREKAAIHYAEILDELRRYFTESEILDLGWRIVTFVGYGRFIHVLDLEVGKTCSLQKRAVGL